MNENLKIGNWTIEPDGSMIHEKPYYCIEGAELNQGNWLTHMVSKTWVDAREFVRAYFAACRCRGLHQVTINADYIF